MVELVWNLMSKQRLNLAELLAEVLAGRELDLETLLPQRFRRRALESTWGSRRRGCGSRRGGCCPLHRGLGELSYEFSGFGLRGTVGQQLLDFALALVPRAIEQRAVILWGEMRRKQREPRQVNLPPPDALQHGRVLSSEPCSADPLVGGRFREVEQLHAVLEHRWEAFGAVQATRVDFSKVRQKLGLDAFLVSENPRYPTIGTGSEFSVRTCVNGDLTRKSVVRRQTKTVEIARKPHGLKPVKGSDDFSWN